MVQMEQLEKDSNDEDIFHSVTMAEQISWQEGYTTGLDEGKTRGFREGYILGAKKGADIGKEVGFYAGYAAFVLSNNKNDESKSRLLNVCKAIIRLTDSFSDIEPTDEDLTDNFNKIQGKFKQLTSLLSIQLEYKVATDSVKGTSF